jgi:hypothetical protein
MSTNALGNAWVAGLDGGAVESSSVGHFGQKCQERRCICAGKRCIDGTPTLKGEGVLATVDGLRKDGRHSINNL